MTKKEKEFYRKTLLDKKKIIITHLNEFLKDSKESETPEAKDFGDKAEISYAKEHLLNLSDAERHSLTLVEEALKRIEKDAFGQCLLCEKPIPKKRLKVIPWAPYCIKCQVKQEETSF